MTSRYEIHYSVIVGQVLRMYRELLDISLSDMAKRIGMSPSGWSRVETGDTEITLVHLRKAARILGTSSEVILEIATHVETSMQLVVPQVRKERA